MAGVAINGSQIASSLVKDYVVYVEKYQDGNYDDGSPKYTTETRYSDAIITGTVSSDHKIKIQGVSVAVKGDITKEDWIASPTPYPQKGGTIISISPAASGDGQGEIKTGSSKANLQGQPIAIIGSQVKTCLGTITTIQTGNTKMNLPE